MTINKGVRGTTKVVVPLPSSDFPQPFSSAHRMSEKRIGTVLCVESLRSGFEISKYVLRTGHFRVICITNPAGLRAAAALPLDAAIVDCRKSNEGADEAVKQLRDIDSSVPRIAACLPASSIKSGVPKPHLVYDVETLIPRLQTLLHRR